MSACPIARISHVHPVRIMCGRFVSPDQAAIERAWHVGRHNNDPFARRYNVQPTTRIPILRSCADGVELLTARWGLIPHWWTQAKAPKFSFNARIEEAAAKPMWRDAMRNARCLIPAQGWYEWTECDRTDAATGEVRKIKQPYYLCRHDGRLFCFAGLMAAWHRPESASGTGVPMLSCAILTTAATGTIAAVHERIPLVLADAAHAEWLSAQMTAPDAAIADEFVHYAVRPLVNSARNEGPELIEPER